MRQVTLFNYQLENSDPLHLVVGNRQLDITFRWPIAFQEQFDIFERKVAEMSNSDPIVTADGYDRTYDWIDYYNDIPALGAGLEEYWTDLEDKPSSLHDLSDNAAYSEITNRKELAEGLAVQRTNYARILCWYVKIVDDLGNTRTGTIRPGAWINNQDDSWALRFVADIDTIGSEDITRVTLEAETYEFV